MNYTIVRTDSTPELSGQWTGAVWEQALPAALDIFHPKSSRHRPKTRVKLLYDAEHLYVLFRVRDRYVLAVHSQYQDPVCEDSCVELFLQPKPDQGYFNFEMSCIGTLLLYYIEDPTRTKDGFAGFRPVNVHLADEIKRFHSLDGPIDPEIQRHTTWYLEYSIPLSLLEVYCGPLNDPAGQCWRGNLFKCADKSSHPHWASWSPIGGELNFHTPRFFGNFTFADDHGPG